MIGDYWAAHARRHRVTLKGVRLKEPRNLLPRESMREYSGLAALDIFLN